MLETPFPFISKKRAILWYLELFSEKNQFCPFWPIFCWKSTFSGRPCFYYVMSYVDRFAWFCYQWKRRHVTNKAVLKPRVSPAFPITYLCNHCNIRFENTSKYVDTLTLFSKNLNQRSLTPRWPLTPCLLRSHVWLYPRIIVSKSHGNTSMYVDTVINFANYHIHTHTYILCTYYVQNEWSHSLLLNSVQARQLLNSVQARQKRLRKTRVNAVLVMISMLIIIVLLLIYSVSRLCRIGNWFSSRSPALVQWLAGLYIVLECKVQTELGLCMVIYFDLEFRFVKTSFYWFDHVIYRFI